MKKLVLLCAILAMAACSSDRGGSHIGNGERNEIPGSDLPELTTQDHSRIQVVSSEANDIETVIKLKDVTGIDLSDVDKVNRSQLTEKGTKFKKSLGDTFLARTCRAEVILDPEIKDYDPNRPSYAYLISHYDNVSKCPITYERNVASEPKSFVSMGLKVDPNMHVARELDIRKYYFDMTHFPAIQGIVHSEPNAEDPNKTPETGTSTYSHTQETKGSGKINLKGNEEIKISVEFLDDTNTVVENVAHTFVVTRKVTLTKTLEFSDGLKVIGYQWFETMAEGKTETVSGDGGSSPESMGAVALPKVKYYINGFETDRRGFDSVFSMSPMAIDLEDYIKVQ